MNRQAAIATSDPRATEVGAAVLREGGNCVDAAVAAVLVLFVVEPHHCGPGGDAYLLVQLPGSGSTPEALDGAGAVPAGLTVDALAADGLPGIPPFGARSVTVPGAVSLLESALERWGTRTLSDVMGPALELARDGFEARSSLATACTSAVRRLTADPVMSALYLVDEQPLVTGATVVNRQLADFLEELGAHGSGFMYRGLLAGEIADRVAELGGYLTRDDLAAHRTESMTPESTAFAGARVWQLPEPTQGPAVLHALDALGGDAVDGIDAGFWESAVVAITDGLRSVGVDMIAAPWMAGRGGTSHVAVVDGTGGVASTITSVFAPFGSGVGVASFGSSIQNRAAGFLVHALPPRPGKPPHTIIPGLITRDGEAEMAVGVAGGLMQVQGQVQLLVRMLVAGESASSAIEAPRFRVVERGELAIEAGHPLATLHPDGVDRLPGDGGFGCGQIAGRRGGRVTAAADARRGGSALVVDVSGGAP